MNSDHPVGRILEGRDHEHSSSENPIFAALLLALLLAGRPRPSQEVKTAMTPLRVLWRDSSCRRRTAARFRATCSRCLTHTRTADGG